MNPLSPIVYAHTLEHRPADDFIRRMSSSNYYWAKTTADGLPGCEVWQHCMAAAEVAKKIIELNPEYDQLLPEGAISLIAVHDVGKISPGFQTKCPMWRGPNGTADSKTLGRWAQFYEKKHARTTYDVLRRYYKECLRCKSGRFWASCAGAHHGVPVEHSVSTGEVLPEDWWLECKKFIDAITEWYGSLPTQSKRTEPEKRFLVGLMVVADWIASHEACFPTERVVVPYTEHAEKALAKIGWCGQVQVESQLAWTEIFKYCQSPRPIQEYMWNLAARKGIYVIEDTMGGGKTEAALALSYHLLAEGKASGIYFALPTQTTSNRIFYRVKEFVQNCGLSVNTQTMQLAHGNSWLLRNVLYDDAPTTRAAGKNDAAHELRNWFASSKRTLLVPFGVGTIDQALMSIVAVKHRDVRAFALAGKVVILDEVHSYDFYTGSLITELVKQLNESGATVIILSATLTQKKVRELLRLADDAKLSNQYPLVTSCVNNEVQSKAFDQPEQKQISLSTAEMTLDEVAAHAYEKASQGACVLWIRNTVKDAQEAYRSLMSERYEGGPEIGLFHARFPYWRREELENFWIDRLGRDCADRPNGCVLVATQVVEQSVDIDADYLITDLAPTDMLLQRMGRLWRHDRASRPLSCPAMLINVPVGVGAAVQADDFRQFKRACGSHAYVYAPYVLWKTWALWHQRTQILLPQDIRTLIEETYDENIGKQTRISCVALKEMHAKIDAMEAVVGLNQSFAAGTGSEREGVATRYGEVETGQVLLLKNKPTVHADGSCLYEPLHGPEVSASSLCWNFTVAKTVCENSVRVPKWYLTGLIPDPTLQKYGFDGVYPFFVLENGDLEYYNGSTSRLGWNTQIGIEALPEKEINNDEPEFMY